MYTPSWLEHLLGAIESNVGGEARTAADSLLGQAVELGLRLTRQDGHPSGTAVAPTMKIGDAEISLYAIFADGRLAVQLDEIRRVNPFKIETREEDLRSRLARINGLDMSKLHHPDMALASLGEESLGEFETAIAWAVAKLRGSNPS